MTPDDRKRDLLEKYAARTPRLVTRFDASAGHAGSEWDGDLMEVEIRQELACGRDNVAVFIGAGVKKVDALRLLQKIAEKVSRRISIEEVLDGDA